MIRVFFITAVFASITAHAGPVTNFDDIEFWAGTGANQAALAIDWDGPGANDNSLVWGYQWNGAAKGVDMLTAIVMADDRLYAKIGPISGFGFGVVGLGYDVNNDGQFALSDGTFFDQYGISNEVPSDGAVSVDAADWYAEAWLVENFWNYGIATTSPFDGGTWTRSGGGVSTRNLVDGSWDSLAFSPIDTLHYAQNPLAAEPPAGDADFDEDGDVDGRDFLVWQRGQSPNPLSNSDLAEWQAAYGGTALSAIDREPEGVPRIPAANTSSLPEPSTTLLLGVFLVLLTRLTRHN